MKFKEHLFSISKPLKELFSGALIGVIWQSLVILSCPLRVKVWLQSKTENSHITRSGNQNSQWKTRVFLALQIISGEDALT